MEAGSNAKRASGSPLRAQPCFSTPDRSSVTRDRVFDSRLTLKPAVKHSSLSLHDQALIKLPLSLNQPGAKLSFQSFGLTASPPTLYTIGGQLLTILASRLDDLIGPNLSFHRVKFRDYCYFSYYLYRIFVTKTQEERIWVDLCKMIKNRSTSNLR